MGKIISMLGITCCWSLNYAQAREENIIIHSIYPNLDAPTISFNITGKRIESRHFVYRDEEIVERFNRLESNKENMVSKLDFLKVNEKSYFGGKFLNMAFPKTPCISAALPINLSFSIFNLGKDIKFTTPSFKGKELYMTHINGKIEIISPVESKGWLSKIVITPMSFKPPTYNFPFDLMLGGRLISIHPRHLKNF
ncbi:MAG: hypothetical protein K0M45_01565 [Candidatus Paracaedibacteraceae bacterium]|nr:hypothetical protein [Candidatus Paracaedibacteraceae bacterium]